MLSAVRAAYLMRRARPSLPGAIMLIKRRARGFRGRARRQGPFFNLMKPAVKISPLKTYPKLLWRLRIVFEALTIAERNGSASLVERLFQSELSLGNRRC